MALPLHFHLVQAIADSIDEIFSEGKYADKVIEKCFKKNRKWGSRDRKFFAETVYEIVRHKRRLAFVAGADQPWDLIAAYVYQTMNELPDWPEFDSIKISDLKKRNSAEKPPEVANSFPDWLHELGKNEFGSEWNKIMNALNAQAEVFLRTNTLKSSDDKLMQQLASEEIKTELVFENCIKLVVRKNVFITQAFKKGFFEVQDAASQKVAPFLEVQSGMRVVDACAGAGGKSLHLASMMKNKGKIISMDIHEWKLKELKTRAARDGVDIIETKVIESNKTIKRLEASFDRVLLDVPCSGLGVLRRNPDTKWKLSIEEINRLVNLQREIILDYSKMCKVAGKMVYATCSILHRENEEQVKWFLNTDEGKKWKFIREMRLWPHTDKFDGFYAALLEKQL